MDNNSVMYLPICWKCHCYSPEKWLYNRIYWPSNRFKQIKETHTAYSAGTQYTRLSLNEKQHTWPHRRRVIGCEAMYAVFHSNFAAYIVCQGYKPCEFPGFVWTDCWSNKSNYVITSPTNISRDIWFLQSILYTWVVHRMCIQRVHPASAWMWTPDRVTLQVYLGETAVIAWPH